MEPIHISGEEFKERLIAMCLSGTGSGFPRKQRDRFILLGSSLQMMEPGRTYSELEVNDALRAWRRDIGRRIEIDHVTLRRSLVDDGFLVRQVDGTGYSVRPGGNGQVEFAAAVRALNVVDLLDAAELEILNRKRSRSAR